MKVVQSGVNGAQICKVSGYADTAPLAANNTEAGRGLNRRVDIIVLNEQGMKGEPAKLESKAATPQAPR